jgi:hypothetical protein
MATINASFSFSSASGAASTGSSVRYQRLLLVLNKALARSKSQLDLRQIVQECYGDDASIFQDDALLESLLDNMLDKAHKRVVDQMSELLQQRGIEQKLVRLEKVVTQLEQQAIQERRLQESAKAATRQACQDALLPSGLSPTDMLSYQSHQMLLQEEAELQRQIAQEEQAIEELETSKQQLSTHVQTRVRELQETGRELERSADMCSMLS